MSRAREFNTARQHLDQADQILRAATERWDAAREALTRDALLEARNITVATDGGHVTLEGKVHSWSEQQHARRAAWSAPGVTEVTNNLRIAP